MPKYQNHEERMLCEMAIKNGWRITERNKQNHIIAVHPCGAKYPLPRESKNRHTIKRIERQMRDMVSKQ